jgi:hypothetical protein
MSQASLIVWRRAPITPLPATISSSRENGPMLPARCSASLTVASSRSRSSPVDSGMLSNTVWTTRARTSASSKTSPNAATSSSASGTNESIAKKPICAASRWMRSSTDSSSERHVVSAIRWAIARARCFISTRRGV